jgi:YidC/Oxa1 family membrane protein insertase
MISFLFNTYLYNPIYNGLVFLIGAVPYADVGIAVITLTVLVKLILFPLSVKMVRTQMVVKQIEPDIKKLKEKHKDDRQKQAEAMMALYKEKNLNPFSGFLLILIQIPIILALYWVFFKGGLPEINTEIIYSFIQIPEITADNMMFLGFIDVGMKSIFLALLAGVTQYFQMKYAMPPVPARKDKPSFKDDMARSLNLQMRYGMPVMVVFIAFITSAAIALYWTTSNLFAIGQELVIRKRVRRSENTNQNHDSDIGSKTKDVS